MEGDEWPRYFGHCSIKKKKYRKKEKDRINQPFEQLNNQQICTQTIRKNQILLNGLGNQ